MQPLTEKYRPIQFSEMIGGEELSKITNLLKNPADMPSFLFWGPAGTGKTTAAKIILDKLNPIDYIRINGSDTTGVDIIRDRVYNFITSMSTQKGKPKIVWIEEFDYMTQNAFAALRSMMEQYIKNARFLVTCNYINKVTDEMKSRFSIWEIDRPTDYEEVEHRLSYICEQEKIKVTGDTLLDLIGKNNGDIRACINDIQKLGSKGEIKSEDVIVGNSLVEDVYKILKEGNWSKIRYEIPNQCTDYVNLLVNLDKRFFESSWKTSIKADVNDVIAKGLYELYFSFDQNITFSAICSRIIRVIK